MNAQQEYTAEPGSTFYASDDGTDPPEEIDPKSKDYELEGEKDTSIPATPETKDAQPLPPGY
jgi:hypothetical protein